MALRPARVVREIKGQNWTRLSQRRPRKSYIKGAPRTKIRQFDMGTLKQYDLALDLIAVGGWSLRDNSLESARQAINKQLELSLPGNYFFKIMKFPHFILREHVMGGVAGADRISKGMKLAFGKVKGRAAHVHNGEPIIRILCYTKDLPAVKEAYRRGRMKMSGEYKLVQGPAPIVTHVVEMKKIEEIKPIAEVAPAAGAAPVPGAVGAAAAPAVEEKKGKK
ncbi:MAG TPA: 50S ribosomal protein L16 [Candidatus Norongarragalinales archaeon]|jgi:large subunit ribosomal protein L10e|nr:50S ribosomal protein L16 [Candidatus Norongarragalinales archaeon]